ncbi:NADAR family protein [Spirillospora sp. NBC_01491]|uniref:NADAR family protein n=1 Tax=Spirillospora sp. NBC_01491 TaxID=2976007 RepID=UPI002E374C66|nr:NADAR family protein [Spirillospora sp. NBC_01491]
MRTDELVELENRAELPEFVLFWGGPEPKGCLSQWYGSPFTLEGVEYATAEHYMMAEKARLFGDKRAESRILGNPSPAIAKSLGRDVRRYDEKTWAAHRYDIVVRGSKAKFAAHADLREYLASTTGKILVEASPEDTVWGIGLDEHQPEAKRPSQWRGLNLLGFALMDARRALA